MDLTRQIGHAFAIVLSGRHIEAFNIDANEGGTLLTARLALTDQASSRLWAAFTRILSALCHGALPSSLSIADLDQGLRHVARAVVAAPS